MENIDLISSFQTLPTSLLIYKHHFEIIPSYILTKDFTQKIAPFGSSWKHLCKLENDNIVLFERYGREYWIAYNIKINDMANLQCELKELNNNCRLEGTSAKIIEFYQQEFPRVLENMNIDKNKSEVIDNLKLKMLPPNKTIEEKSTQTYDAKSYLEMKYYEGLFSLNIPLAYFVKATLSRFRSLCKSSNKEDYLSFFKETISRFCMSIDAFNKKHQYNKLITTPSEDPQIEKLRESFLLQLNVDLNEEEVAVRNDISMLLKSREIKLQIIIILELVIINNLDDKFLDFEINYENKLKKRSLNLAKPSVIKNRNRIKLKSQLSTKEQSSTTENNENSLHYAEQLDLYLDNLNILDILLTSQPEEVDNDDMNKVQEQKFNMLNKNKESSSFGFINYVLVPFYSKKIPNTVKFIIKKLKGPSLKSRSMTERKTSKRSQSELSNDDKDYELSNTSSQSSSKYSSTLASPRINAPPFLKRRTSKSTLAPEILNGHSNSNLSELLESNSSFNKPASLLRTNSDMNMLQKRQLSVTELSTLSKDTNNFGHDSSHGSQSNFNQQQSFRRVGKKKLLASSNDYVDEGNIVNTQNVSEMVQVTATPLIKRKITTKEVILNSIVESPILAETPTAEGRIISNSSPLNNELPPRETEAINIKKKVRRRLFAPSK